MWTNILTHICGTASTSMYTSTAAWHPIWGLDLGHLLLEFNDSYRVLMSNIMVITKQVETNGKFYHGQWLGNIIKLLILLKSTYLCHTIPNSTPGTFTVRTDAAFKEKSGALAWNIRQRMQKWSRPFIISWMWKWSVEVIQTLGLMFLKGTI